MDGGTLWATVHGVAKSQTRLNDFTTTTILSKVVPSALPSHGPLAVLGHWFMINFPKFY